MDSREIMRYLPFYRNRDTSKSRLEIRKARVIRNFFAPLQVYGGIRGVMREFGLVHLLDAGLREAWFRIGMRILRVVRSRTIREYGWLEAFFFPAYDYFLRYARIIEALPIVSGKKPIRVLEVASGRGGIAWFMSQPSVQVCLVDQTVGILAGRHTATAWRVCADACMLPFPDASFDVVISVDTVEHILRPRRVIFLEELKRIADQGVILSCPLDSTDGDFQAREFDLRLERRIRAHKGKVPRWLDDHIGKGHPTKAEFMEVFDGARIEGSQNCETWLRFQSLYLRPLVWIVAGFFYLLILKKRDAWLPHRRGLLVWQKKHLCLEGGFSGL